MTDIALTDEQKAIIDKEGSFKVIAIAGSGKTTSLVLKAKKINEPVLLVCFNRRSKVEAEKIALDNGVGNLVCENIHSLAFKYTMSGKSNRGKKKIVNELPAEAIMDYLKLSDDFPEINDCFAICTYIKIILGFYCNGSMYHFNELQEKFFPDQAELFYDNFEALLEYADKVFEGMLDGELPMTHDTYLKMFFLSEMALPFRHIFFDEAQDASPVIVETLTRQKADLVFVGDEHQQIYSFRYAVDTLKNLDLPELSLSVSFRFGEEIARCATHVLDAKKQLGLPLRHETVRGSDVATQKRNNFAAVIARTNLGLFRSAIDLLSFKHEVMKKIYFEGDISSYQKTEGGVSVYDVLNLFEGNRPAILSPVLKAMSSYNQLKVLARATGDNSLSMLMELVERHKDALPGLLKELKKRSVASDQKSDATVIFSTAHKAKGLEYDEVILDEDFVPLHEILIKFKEGEWDYTRAAEEINLIYVSITRTKGTTMVPSRIFDF